MATFQVEHIDHVEMFVPDRRAAAQWYERVLGLRVLQEFEFWSVPSGGPLMISSDNGRTKLALFEGQPPRERPTAGFRRVAFCVSRAGLAAFLDHIQTNPVYDETGCEIRELKIIDHVKAHSVYFCDPYGHRLEITTYEA